VAASGHRTGQGGVFIASQVFQVPLQSQAVRVRACVHSNRGTAAGSANTTCASAAHTSQVEAAG
jgi:hypothetical protein